MTGKGTPMSETRVSLNTLTHVHVVRTARDCDSRYDRDYIATPGPGETFRELWTGYAMRRLDVTWNYNVLVRRGTDEDGYPFLEYVADTEEGFEHEDIYGCDDPQCDPDKTRFRDHTAEAMGY